MKKTVTGFSLIELLTSVVIVGILAAVAVPAYLEQMAKVRRSDAKSALETCANAMERFYTQNFTYIGTGTEVNVAGDVNGSGPPDAAICPSLTDYYSIVINDDSTATTYTLRATPIVGSKQDGDGYLELTSTSGERWDRNDDTDTDDANEHSWD